VRNIKIVFSYDGGLFYGSQSQSNGKTVQDELERAIYDITREKVRIALAGRTDRGVHAFSQVGNFLTGSKILAEKFPGAINSKLGKGIIVNNADEVPLLFNARKQAKTREYLYFVYNGRVLPVLFWDRVLHVKDDLDIKKMEQVAKGLIGRHNFVNFCGKGSSQNHFVRRIHELEIACAGQNLVEEGKMIVFRVVADSFLYKMVRFIVGTLLEIGSSRLSISSIADLLKGERKDIKRAIVPSCGLYLSKVKY
jgi:tRNA pseudouridine38-40 synthase